MKNPIQISGADQILSIFIFQFGQNLVNSSKIIKNCTQLGQIMDPAPGAVKIGEAKRGLGGA
jgi:hypothetical protein